MCRLVLLEQLLQRNEEKYDARGDHHRSDRHLPLREQRGTDPASGHRGDRGDHERPHRDSANQRIVESVSALRERAEDLQRP
jgi:capsid protein